ncbi:MAG: hypothetical protein IJS07_03460, partial [Bacteroidales bacterium]|nr:hypothetical protein [Bacteroidales bacterium]
PGSAVFNTYDNHTDIHGYLTPRLTQSVARDSLNATVTTTNVWSYDRFDLPTASSVSYARPVYDDTNEEWDFTQTEAPQWRDSTTTTYAHKFSSQKFAIGLPTETRQIRIHPTKGQWTKRTTVQYDTTGTGAMFLPLEIKEYTGVNGDQLVSTTTRTYSPPNFSGGYPGGRMLTEQTAPYNATTYTGKTYTYSSDPSFPGRYLETETDPLGHTTTYSNYDYFGHPRTVTDHKNRSTTYTYDIWGNLTSRTDIDGTVTTISRSWASENGDRPAARNALIKTTASTAGHPTTVTYTDALGRKVKSGEMRMDGRYTYVSREYDKRSKVIKRSLPYKTSYDSGVLWNTYTYDDYGRPTLSQEASGIQSSVTYLRAVNANGPGQPNGQNQNTDEWQTGITTVKENVTSTKAYDVMGNLLQASDAGGTIRYSYRPDGQLDTLYAPGGYLTVFTYDSFGRRASITDPSIGTRTSSEVWSADGTCTRTETNDKGSITTAYDVYGRKTSVTRTGPGAFNTTYTYNTDGFLSASTSTNGTSQEYTYDEYDRPRAERFYAPDSRAFVRVSNYATSADGGRLSSYQYVSLGTSLYTETIRYTNGCYTGVGTGNNPDIKITSENDLGLPTAMNTDFSDTRYYSYDIYGRQTERTVTGFILPNPDRDTLQRFTYQYGSTDAHNITRRGEQVNGTQEIFLYDNLDRLKGDLTTRTTYDSLGNIRSINFKSQQYDDPLHPYRQTGGSVDGSFSRSQQIVYTAFDRPHTIREGNRVATFTYNDSHQRVKMEMADTLGNVIYTRYYLGGCWELDVAGTTTTERLYVGGDYYSAPLVKERKKTGNNWPIINTYSLCRDIIGSVTYIPNGNSPYEYSYNVWGRSRDPGTLTPDAFGTDPGFRFHRGWGGHEYLPEFGLYNCNARLYDPLYGRFLSPDPYVQAPDFTQNLNRYSYALNNPLKYSDETGEFVFSLFLGPIGAIIDAACWGALIGGAGYTASIAFSKGGFDNWDWKQFGKAAAVGAVSGVVTFGIGQMCGAIGSMGIEGELARAYLHGYSNGLISYHSGGDFLQGFAAGALGSVAGSAFMMYGGSLAASPIGTYAFSGLAGGTGAALTGGNFWKGAATGVMSAGLNHLSQLAQRPSFEDLLLHYPLDENGNELASDKVYEYIGGNVLKAHENNPRDFRNACALRVSTALNGSGVDLPNIPLKTLRGANGKYYFYRVEDLNNWLRQNYNQPDITTRNFSSLQGNQGIYIMRASYPNEFGAWGHATLYDMNKTIGHSFYGAKTYEMYLWKF